jgi:hypothetical protein
MQNPEDELQEPRGERREKKRVSRMSKMIKHGKGLAKVYRDAVLKRLKKEKAK